MNKFHSFSSVVLGAVFMMSAPAIAQSNEDYPPNAEVGKCYAKCLIPYQYKTQTEQMQRKASTKKMQVIPAEYGTNTKQVLVQSEAKRYIPVPAIYETVTEQITAKEASTRKEYIPAEYETVTEQVEITPAFIKRSTTPPIYETVEEKVLISEPTTRWERGKKDPNCLSANPEDCRVMCLVEVPAQYKAVQKQVIKVPASVKEDQVPAVYSTITKRMIKTPATVREIAIPAEYKTITRQVLKTPAAAREELIPAQYKTVTVRNVKTPEKVLEVDIPAEYETVTKTVMVKKGGYSEWREVLCESEMTTSKVSQIQAALKAKGYNTGPIDNVMGSQTRAALLQFQKDNALPQGNVNIETLKALGINR